MVVRRNTAQLRDFVMVLSVQGPSETGDLHKTSQCCDIHNGLRTRSLTCLCGSPYLVVLNGFSGRDRVSHQDRHRDKSHRGRATKKTPEAERWGVVTPLRNVEQQCFAPVLNIEDLGGRNVFPISVLCESQQRQEILMSVSGVIHISQGRPNRLSAFQTFL